MFRIPPIHWTPPTNFSSKTRVHARASVLYHYKNVSSTAVLVKRVILYRVVVKEFGTLKVTLCSEGLWATRQVMTIYTNTVYAFRMKIPATLNLALNHVILFTFHVETVALI